MDITKLQKSDGSWDKSGLPLILELYSITETVLNGLKETLGGHLDLLLTVLALHLLERQSNLPENALIIRKAKEWILRVSMKLGVSSQ